MSDTELPEREMGPVAVQHQQNGMVLIITGDTGMEGTWIDGIEFAHDIVRESLAAARELGVDRRIVVETMMRIAQER